MPVDETHLRELAKSLAAEYRTLHSMKHDVNAPEARVMKARPGPSNPGNWLNISCYIDNETKLRQLALNAFHDCQIRIKDTDFTAPRICDIIAYNAQAISELNWANDLVDEMASQEKAISRRTNQTQDTTKPTPNQDWKLTAAQAATATTKATGRKITRKQITYWGNAGYIPTHQAPGQPTKYLLSDTIRHANQTHLHDYPPK